MVFAASRIAPLCLSDSSLSVLRLSQSRLVFPIWVGSCFDLRLELSLFPYWQSEFLVLCSHLVVLKPIWHENYRCGGWLSFLSGCVPLSSLCSSSKRSACLVFLVSDLWLFRIQSDWTSELPWDQTKRNGVICFCPFDEFYSAIMGFDLSGLDTPTSCKFDWQIHMSAVEHSWESLSSS